MVVGIDVAQGEISRDGPGVTTVGTTPGGGVIVGATIAYATPVRRRTIGLEISTDVIGGMTTGGVIVVSGTTYGEIDLFVEFNIGIGGGSGCPNYGTLTWLQLEGVKQLLVS